MSSGTGSVVFNTAIRILPVVQPGETLTPGMKIAANTIQNTDVGATTEAIGQATAKTQLPVGTLGTMVDQIA